MPQIVHREQKSSQTKAPASGSAASKQRPPNGARRDISVIWVVAASALTLVLIAFLYNNYVHRLVPKAQPSKVAPLPGFRDEFPYNSKEWQDAYLKGRAPFLSGVPRMLGPQGAGAPNRPTGGAGGR